MNDEAAGLANIMPITTDDKTVDALYPGAEGVGFWVDMLMVSPLSHNLNVNKLPIADSKGVPTFSYGVFLACSL